MASTTQNKQNAGHEEKVNIELMMSRLEDDLRKLKVEFDIFFNGGTKRPPYDTKNRVETLVKRIGDQRKMTYAERYQYNSLVAKYTAFKEQWRRTLQGREEGRNPIMVARAAAQRAREVHENHTTFVCKDVRNDDETITKLYNTLIAAKEKCGEPVNDMNFQSFHQFLTSKADNIKRELGCEKIMFSVAVIDGKVAFKAKAG